jgi:hypothetical protein
MAFSGSSYFAGVGTVVAAIGLGFACGAMIMKDVVQPQNRLERVNAGPIAPSKTDATPSSAASSGAEQASTAKPPAQDPPSAVAAAAPAAAADPNPAPQPQPAAPTAAKADAATSIREQPAPAMTRNSTPAPVANKDDPALAKSEHATVGRAPDPNREASRKRDDRKFSERRRRHDQDPRQLDEATNVVRSMPRGYTPDEYVERDDTPRIGTRPRHFGLFEDDDSPRVINEPPPPPRFGLFGN